MKKILTIILSLVLLCSVLPAENAEATSINKQAGKAYAEIIKKHMEVFYDGKRYDDINDLFVYGPDGGYDFANNDVTYRITDLNKDGTPELYIGLSGGIYSVYTFSDGKAVKRKDWQGDRAGTGILCKNGIIKTEFWGSAWTGGMEFYKITKDQTVKNILTLFYDTENDGSYTQVKNGETIEITEAEYDEICKKYDKPIKTTFYKADSKALKNIKQGKFSYKGQKSWKD